jgi:uncharacterized membrane protein YqjE
MSSGLLHSAQALLGTLLALARTRLDLFSTELQEELNRLAAALLGAVVLLLLGALAAGFAGAALVFSVPQEARPLTAAICALVFLGLALAGAWGMHRAARARTRPLAASLAELERDQAAVQP